MTPEDPVVAEMRRARVARMNRPVTLWPSPLTDSRHRKLYEAATEGLPEPDWKSSGLEQWRQQQRESRIATVVLWVALLAMLALVGGAAIAVGSGALD